jgi:hypothetical protein
LHLCRGRLRFVVKTNQPLKASGFSFERAKRHSFDQELPGLWRVFAPACDTALRHTERSSCGSLRAEVLENVSAFHDHHYRYVDGNCKSFLSRRQLEKSYQQRKLIEKFLLSNIGKAIDERVSRRR